MIPLGSGEHKMILRVLHVVGGNQDQDLKHIKHVLYQLTFSAPKHMFLEQCLKWAVVPLWKGWGVNGWGNIVAPGATGGHFLLT